jgi:hypothetical protein
MVQFSNNLDKNTQAIAEAIWAKVEAGNNTANLKNLKTLKNRYIKGEYTKKGFLSSLQRRFRTALKLIRRGQKPTAAAAALAAGASSNAGKLAALSAVLNKFNGKNNTWYSNQNLNALSANVNSAANGVTLNANARARLNIVRGRINAARKAKAPPNAAAAALAAGASNNAGKLAELSAVLNKFNGKNNTWYSNKNLNALSANVNSAANGVTLNTNARARLNIVRGRINAARKAKAPPNAAVTSANKYKTMNIKNLLEAVKSVSNTNRNALRAAILAKKVAWRGGPQIAQKMGQALSNLTKKKKNKTAFNLGVHENTGNMFGPKN